MPRPLRGNSCVLLAAALFPAHGSAQSMPPLPLVFEANHGQTDESVHFLARGRDHTLFLTSGEAVLVLSARQDDPAVLRLRLVGARSGLPAGLTELPSRSHYFMGRNPAAWRTGVPHYAKVRYGEVYPGIDLVYYGNQGRMEFDFVVAPEADPQDIRLAVSGVAGIEVEESGDLVLRPAGGDLRLLKPQVYQEEEGGGRRTVPGRYVLRARAAGDGGPSEVGFEIGEYDPGRPLVIDPLLTYSTYLGGSDSDRGMDVAVDGDGNMYVVGTTLSANFPTAGALQPAFGGGVCPDPLGRVFPCADVFIAKLGPAGSALLYSTYLGGSGGDGGNGIAVDALGNAYIVGSTDSIDFPTANPFQAAPGGGNCGTLFRCPDAFVAKVSPSGSALVYSTYLGGSASDSGADIAVDADGHAHVTGLTLATDFPTVNAFQPNFGGQGFPGGDAFVTKLSPAGSALVFSTYLGGNAGDEGAGIAVGPAGHVYVTGSTRSPNFPVANAFDATYGGGNCGGGEISIPCPDVFVAKLDADGSSLAYSTYLGGDTDDIGQAIDVDAVGHAYVTGLTASRGFPVTAGALQTALAGGADAFVTKLGPSGSALVYSTYLGGAAFDFGVDIAVDGSGRAHVTGSTESPNFPTASPVQPAYAGGICRDSLDLFNFPCPDVFVTTLCAPGTALVQSTYLGGTGEDRGRGLAIDANHVYVAGPTSSANFPTARPLQGANAGAFDAFVARLTVGPEVVVRITSGGENGLLSVSLANGGAAESVELKLWVESPGLGLVSLVGIPGLFSLPPAPVTEVVSNGVIPRELAFPGTTIGARLLRPASGEVLSESVCTAVPCH
jgi:Beta-propeller repeat